MKKILLALAIAGATGLAVSSLVAATVDEASPIFGVKIPHGYREWQMIGVAHEAGVDELRGVLGNATAMKAYRQHTLPFPDGTVLAKLAWKHVPLPGLNGAFVTGASTTVQIMVKDSKKYAATGGWGFGRFIDGKPADEAQHKTCFGCHQAHAGDHDFVFTRYAH
ncbi:cytochrome P460 family protein [Bradyrhizobium lablabi]|uniref:cytochrome P460 family protein n=1 Tax=Bradyrhizobium lablabi TaxID=722472 RepID=UPI001BA4E4FB|nr:cytochrome P460 family protein [Bradyrhizobium lablabi]MBR1122346.1 cytochrome P460 family protein [Bradyrhizobium lablabi]